MVIASAAKPDPFFLASTQFWAQFSGSNRSGWCSGSKNGLNWVGLTFKKVQIWIQSYFVIINPIWTLPNPFLGRNVRVQSCVESGWVGSQCQNLGRDGQVHLAAQDYLSYSGGRLCLPQKLVPTKFWKPPVRLKCALDQLGWSFVGVKKIIKGQMYYLPMYYTYFKIRMFQRYLSYALSITCFLRDIDA